MRLLTRREGRLPNLIILGAMKAGTSSLHYYLDQHPDIQMSRTKELRFFIEERNWSRGLDWYRSQFSGTVPVAGESTPGYTHFPVRTGVAQRMHQTIPEAKLVYIVRDPIDRTVSHYVHAVASGQETRTLDEAVTHADEPYITRSRYYMQIEQYLDFYSRDQILIVNTSDLARKRAETLREVFRFLGVDETFESDKYRRIRGPSQGRRRPTTTGLRIGAFIDRTLSSLPPARRDLIKRPLLLPFSRRMERPVLGTTANDVLRSLLIDDVRAFREWTDNALEAWSI